MSEAVCPRRDSTRARRDSELVFCCSALVIFISEISSHSFGVTAKLEKHGQGCKDEEQAWAICDKYLDQSCLFRNVNVIQ